MKLRKLSKQELDKIIDNHKLWLNSECEKGERADLSYADLRYVNLSYADLDNADLSYADLSNANLHNANLHNANLHNADLSNADLSNADLSYANLSYADLSNANLRHANLRYAVLRKANLHNADLDYSAFPLCCGGLDVHIDDRQATQLLYHLLRNIKYSNNTSKKLKRLLKLKSVVKLANEFNRVKACGEITEGEE